MVVIGCTKAVCEALGLRQSYLHFWPWAIQRDRCSPDRSVLRPARSAAPHQHWSEL